MLESDPYEKKWHNDSDGYRVRDPIMDSFRKRGLHLPQEETPPDGQGDVDMTSFGEAVMASGYQVAEKQLHLADSTRGDIEFNDDGDSISSGSMSPDLREKWRYACPKSPDWDSEIEMNSVEEGCVGRQCNGISPGCVIPLQNSSSSS